MEKLTRRRYTLEYKQEAVRLVSSGQKVAAAAKVLSCSIDADAYSLCNSFNPSIIL